MGPLDCGGRSEFLMSKFNGEIAVTDEVTESEVASVLRRLAGRDSRAVWAESGGDAAIISRVGGGEGRRGCENSRIEAAVWQRLLEGGLVVPDRDDDQTGDVWRISNAGRIQLRRLLSRSQSQSETGEGASPNLRASPMPSGVTGPYGEKSADGVLRIDGKGGVARSGGTANPRSGPCSGLEGAALGAPSESPLAWLARRRDKSGRPLISQDEFHAGERLRADFTLGQMMEKVTSSWSPMAGYSKRGAQLDGELTMSEASLDARERVRAALADVGPELSGVLIDVCCYLKGLEATERASGWPQRSGKLVLQMALRCLARHYKSQRRGQQADAA